MYRLILFSEKITVCGETLCGRLYSGQSETSILNAAKKDYKTLLITKMWEGEQGKAFRDREGWTLEFDPTDDLEWWKYDESKYTFLKYPDCYDLPDQFAEEMGRFKEQIAFASKWVPLRIADTDCEGYFINQWMYNTIVGSAEVKWMYLEEPDDDLPF